ncbi:hypothetical protein ACOYR4_05445 [Acidovorax sp. M14]|uniref:hypothetical protein n=1 Tax=Acidovorax sp. M14 TaxID=3411354 RepID=UPI003BF60616
MTNWNVTKEMQKLSEELKSRIELDAVEAMFSTVVKASEPFDVFSTWLLLGTAATGAFMVTNAEKIVPYTGVNGYLGCSAALILSVCCGAVAKIYGVSARSGHATGSEAFAKGKELKEKYESEKQELQRLSEKYGIAVDMRPDRSRIVKEMAAIFPRSMRKAFVENESVNGASYKNAAINVVNQLVWGKAQLIAFIGFLVIGLVAGMLAQIS